MRGRSPHLSPSFTALKCSFGHCSLPRCPQASLLPPAMCLTSKRRSLRRRRSHGSAKWLLTGLQPWFNCLWFGRAPSVSHCNHSPCTFRLKLITKYLLKYFNRYTTNVEEDFNIVAPYIDRVDFHFVAASQGPYPVNAMRNVALEHARTRYVLLADIDFYPSESISTLAEQWSEK